MNISLYGDDQNFGGDDNLQIAIERHQSIMAGAGYNIIGPAVLVPEGARYPGSYQVWWPIAHDDALMWVYIDTAGEPDYRRDLPSAEAMIR